MPTKITVLVVKDEALLRMNTVDELTDQGLQVVEAANAKEAIAISGPANALNASLAS